MLSVISLLLTILPYTIYPIPKQLANFQLLIRIVVRLVIPSTLSLIPHT